MRLNLIINHKDKIQGYINASPIVGEGIVECKLNDLNALCDDSELDELRAYAVVDFMPAGTIMAVISHWAKKVRKGGRLVVGGTDLREVARALHSGVINEDKANELLYNAGQIATKSSCGTCEIMCNVFQAVGFKVEDKAIRQNHYIVAGVKQ